MVYTRVDLLAALVGGWLGGAALALFVEPRWIMTVAALILVGCHIVRWVRFERNVKRCR